MGEEVLDYQRKIKICEKLGALKFQKVVFKIEDLKYKVLKGVCPNFINYYDKYCDFQRNRSLKKLHSDSTKKEVVEKYRNQKILMRKELKREENRNYHMDMNKPTEFIHYLEWNKKVHVFGLKKNLITIPALAIATACGIAPAIPLLGLEVVNSVINLSCINIQNYNIYRFKEEEKRLLKIQQIRQKRSAEQYLEGARVLTKALDKTVDIPSLQEIINNVESKEELQKLRKLIQANMSRGKINSEKDSNLTKKVQPKSPTITEHPQNIEPLSNIDGMVNNIKTKEELLQLREVVKPKDITKENNINKESRGK